MKVSSLGEAVSPAATGCAQAATKLAGHEAVDDRIDAALNVR